MILNIKNHIHCPKELNLKLRLHLSSYLTSAILAECIIYGNFYMGFVSHEMYQFGYQLCILYIFKKKMKHMDPPQKYVLWHIIIKIGILFIQVTFYLIVIPSVVLAILLFVILCIIAWINTLVCHVNKKCFLLKKLDQIMIE